MNSYLVMGDGSRHTIGNKDITVECFRCGVCCMRYRPKVTQEEIEKIAVELSLSEEEFIRKFVCTIPEKAISIIQNDEDHCPFLKIEETTNKATCTIHYCRPHACIDWQAGLFRTECQEGLNMLNPERTLLLPENIYSTPQEIKDFYKAISDNE